jgi:rRNA processing protein Gar1
MYLENKTQIGKVEEILGSVNNVVRVFTCKRGGQTRVNAAA